jgi:hypothetical protein
MHHLGDTARIPHSTCQTGGPSKLLPLESLLPDLAIASPVRGTPLHASPAIDYM